MSGPIIPESAKKTSDARSAPVAWHSAKVMVFKGSTDTRIHNGVDYRQITLLDLFQMQPGDKSKDKALAMIPSSYNAHDGRSHPVQREKGSFVTLDADIDKGNHTREEVCAATVGFVGTCAALVYSSAHARIGDMRWRIVAPLDQPLTFVDWHDAQNAFFDHLEAQGFTVDRSLNRAAQPVFLPNVPAVHTASGTPLRGEDGKPLYYRYAYSPLTAPGITLDSPHLAAGITRIREKRAEDEKKREDARAAAAEKREKVEQRREAGELSPIEWFNANHSIADLMLRYGYVQSPANDNDWRSPNQTSGSYATRIYGEIDGEYWVSLSGADADTGLGRESANGGRHGDSFDLFCHYVHCGDTKAAVAAAETESLRVANGESIFIEGGAGDTNRPGTVGNVNWPEPADLWATPSPAPLPVGLLPPVIEKYALGQSRQMGADAGGLAMSALAVCCAAISDRYQVQVKRHDPDWRESARIWVALIGTPSTRKTPIVNDATRPLAQIDSALFGKFCADHRAYLADQKLPPTTRQGVAPAKQHRVRLTDTTTEAAQIVLADSPDGVMVVHDELSGWFGAMEKAGSRGTMADRAFWLMSYNGGQHPVNRITRAVLLIPNLSVTMLGGIQPDLICTIARGTQDDGLLQRFIPIPLTEATEGHDEPRIKEVDAYRDIVGVLHNRKGIFATALVFDDAAQAIRRDLECEHLQLVKVAAVHPKLGAHFGKYDGLFARLCVLWHLIESGNAEKVSGTITGPTAERVAQFMRAYLRRNAVAFYVGTLGLSDEHDDLVTVAVAILKHRPKHVNLRFIQRASRTLKGVTAEDGRLLCERLESLGWVVQSVPASGTRTPAWGVNPRVHEIFQERGAEEIAARSAMTTQIKAELGL